jgi:cation:H+ antiporter
MDFLLPESLFASHTTPVLLLLLAMGIAVLVYGADRLVDGSVGLSERLGVPKVIVGATIISLGTTTPEAAVSVMAALYGDAQFALGNSVGSIICDTGLIFGLCCLLSRLPLDRFVMNRHGWIQFGAGVLLVVASTAFWDAGHGVRVLPRFVGVIFLALLVIYMAMSVKWAREHSEFQIVIRGRTEKEVEDKEAGKPVRVEAMWMAVGLALILFSSHVMIKSVTVLCDEKHLNISTAIVAATLVALGTSLPELATGIASIRKGHKELLVGNIIGADILNVLFVAGAAACAAPLTVEPLFLRLHFPVMIAILVLFRLVVACSRGTTFPRWPGVLFLGLYGAYLVGNIM